MVHSSSLNRPACVGYCLPHGLLCYTLQAAWHDMRTLAAVTDSRLLYTAGTLKNEKQAKTLRGRKDTLALVYFYWGGGDRPPRPLGIDATAAQKIVDSPLSI